MRFIRKIGRSVRYLLGFDRLEKDFYAFLRVYFCFAVAMSINTVFISTFLLKSTGNTWDVMSYNLVLYTVQPLSMLFSVAVIRRFNAVRSQQVAFLLYIATFLMIAVMGESAVRLKYLIAVLLSCGLGFYYNGYIIQIVECTRDETRDTALGVQSLVANLIVLIVPLLAGFLASAFVDFTGYRLLFGIASFMAFLAIFFSTKMFGQEAKNEPVRLRPVARTLFTDPPARDAMLVAFISSVRDGTLAFFLNMLLYSLVSNETLIGVNSFLGSLCGILSAVVYSRIIRPERRVRGIFLSTTLLMSIALLLLLRLSPITIICYNICNCALVLFISNPTLSAYMNVIQKHPALQGCGAEVHTVREYFVAAGRALGILTAMILPQNNLGYVLVLVVLTAVQYVSCFLVNRIDRAVNKMTGSGQNMAQN